MPAGRPTLVAHRGYAARYPENTLPALQAAVAAGATFVEFDVQSCRDHTPVLLHDTNLARTGGHSARIWDLDVSDLGGLPVGEPERFHARFSDVCIPTLADVVAWWQTQPGLTAFVELKDESLKHFGIEPMLNTVLPVLEPVRPGAILISYEINLVPAVRERTALPVGWVLPEWSEHALALATEHSPDYLVCNWKRMPPVPDPLWDGAWKWVAYEVTDPGQALALAERGVEFVETMAIGEMLGDPLFGN